MVSSFFAVVVCYFFFSTHFWSWKFLISLTLSLSIFRRVTVRTCSLREMLGQDAADAWLIGCCLHTDREPQQCNASIVMGWNGIMIALTRINESIGPLGVTGFQLAIGYPKLKRFKVLLVFTMCLFRLWTSQVHTLFSSLNLSLLLFVAAEAIHHPTVIPWVSYVSRVAHWPIHSPQKNAQGIWNLFFLISSSDFIVSHLEDSARMPLLCNEAHPMSSVHWVMFSDRSRRQPPVSCQRKGRENSIVGWLGSYRSRDLLVWGGIQKFVYCIQGNFSIGCVFHFARRRSASSLLVIWRR